MTRVAAIDCGTNTIKLLVADLDQATGVAVEHSRQMRMVRLGQGVDRTGHFAEQALERVFAAIDEYAAIIDGLQVGATRFCATSAARDASNADVFVRGVEQRLGVVPEVLTGDEEAQLSYDGATRALTGREHRAPFLVVDIGGGSTELILGDGRGHVRAARSLDIGSVRMTERHLHSDPATEQQIAETMAAIDATLDGCDVPLQQAATVVGVAGTITTVAAGVLDLPEYDRDAIDHAVIRLVGIDELTRSFLTMSTAERATLPYMHPGRADVIGAGALILDRVLRRTSVESLLVSEADILDGIAWSIA
ncbi:MAG TPA: Ppx/GppA phosphatase family protein [Nocardioidaceae bacterium]|nr:Ppx/GppA phosphatase family protein [Nocardioidaceae bacterium]